MKSFDEVIKLKTIPTTFIFRCSLCGFEAKNYDRHFGLIEMNEHLIQKHPIDVRSLDKEDLYSRKPSVELEEF